MTVAPPEPPAPLLTSGELERWAIFSEDKRYRYVLGRRFAGHRDRLLRLCVWLNPSKADDKDDDASIRVGLSFAKRWGDAGLVVVNVFDLVETASGALPKATTSLLGPKHWDMLARAMRGEYGHCRPLAVCGWGDKGAGEHADRVVTMLKEHGFTPGALALTKAGNPSHPLRKSLALVPRPYSPETGTFL